MIIDDFTIDILRLMLYSTKNMRNCYKDGEVLTKQDYKNLRKKIK